MRVFLFIPILILLIAQSQSAQVKSDNSSVEVLGFQWSKSRHKVENPEKQDSSTAMAQSALSPANRNFQRNRRINDPAGRRIRMKVQQRRAARVSKRSFRNPALLNPKSSMVLCTKPKFETLARIPSKSYSGSINSKSEQILRMWCLTNFSAPLTSSLKKSRN